MALNFKSTASKTMVDNVMKKVDETELDNKKRDIPLDQIDLNPDNEGIFGYADVAHLASRIKENGFYGAIDVYAKKDGRYEISSGHRRYLACKSLGMATIPCIVSAEVNDVEKAKHLIEGNIHNRVMTPYMMAKAIKYYDDNVVSKMKKELKKETGLFKRQYIAEIFNISETSVQRFLSILKLIPELQELTNTPNMAYTNIIDLANFPEEVQRDIYNQLKELAGENGIESLSKAIITQVSNQYNRVKKEDDKRSEKGAVAETDRRVTFIEDNDYESHQEVDDSVDVVSIKTETEEKIEDYVQNEDVTFNEESSFNGVSAEDDIIPTDSVLVEEDSYIAGDIPTETVESKPVIRREPSDGTYLKVRYYVQLIEDVDNTFEKWTKDDRKEIKKRLEKVLEKLEAMED